MCTENSEQRLEVRMLEDSIWEWVWDRELSDSFPFHSEEQGGQKDIPNELAWNWLFSSIKTLYLRGADTKIEKQVEQDWVTSTKKTKWSHSSGNKLQQGLPSVTTPFSNKQPYRLGKRILNLIKTDFKKETSSVFFLSQMKLTRCMQVPQNRLLLQQSVYVTYWGVCVCVCIDAH